MTTQVPPRDPARAAVTTALGWSVLALLGALGAVFALATIAAMAVSSETRGLVAQRWQWIVLYLLALAAWAGAIVLLRPRIAQLRSGVRPRFVLPGLLTLVALLLGGVSVPAWQAIHGVATLALTAATIAFAARIPDHPDPTTGDH